MTLAAAELQKWLTHTRDNHQLHVVIAWHIVDTRTSLCHIYTQNCNNFYSRPSPPHRAGASFWVRRRRRPGGGGGRGGGWKPDHWKHVHDQLRVALSRRSRFIAFFFFIPVPTRSLFFCFPFKVHSRPVQCPTLSSFSRNTVSLLALFCHSSPSSLFGHSSMSHTAPSLSPNLIKALYPPPQPTPPLHWHPSVSPNTIFTTFVYLFLPLLTLSFTSGMLISQFCHHHH